MNLSNSVKFSQAVTPTAGAAEKTLINGATLDMAGFDGVLIEVTFGAIVTGAATDIKVQQGKLADASDMQDLAGSKVTVADDQDGKIFLIDLYRPQERYIRLVVDRATQNATVAAATYLQYQHSGVLPVNQSADVSAGKVLISPDEGTA